MIFRRIFAALALFCALMAPAHAQKSKATLDAEVNTNWPDNATGAITPSLLRSTVLDTISSYVDWLSCTGTGGIVFWNGGTPTCLTAGSNGQLLSLSAGIPAWVNTASNLTAGTCITITGTITPTIGVTGACINTAQMANNAVTNAILATMAGPGLKGSILSSLTASVSDLNPGQIGSILCAPVRTVILTGTNATFTTPACNSLLPTRIEVELQGSGGGGAGSGTSPAPAGSGTNTCWNTSGTACSTPTFVANGGALGNATAPSFAAGGTTSGCDLGITGGNGGAAVTTPTTFAGGAGGISYFGGAGPGAGPSTNPGSAAIANTGSGGGGASSGGTANSGGGGAAGGYCRKIVTSVLSSYVVTIGTGGNAGGAGASGAVGGRGGDGITSATSYWQ